MLDVQTTEHGYTECYTPYIVNREILEHRASCPSSRKTCSGCCAVATTSLDEQYLISTSEISLTNTVREQVLAAGTIADQAHGPQPCFRSEAGSAGRDTRGMIRQHQFDKVEMVQIVQPEHSDAALEEMVGTPRPSCRSSVCPTAWCCCAPAMGFGATKTYDLEVWLPAQRPVPRDQLVLELRAFQARRMQAQIPLESRASPRNRIQEGGRVVECT